VVEGVAGLNSDEGPNSKSSECNIEVLPMASAHSDSVRVLATCHSLVQVIFYWFKSSTAKLFPNLKFYSFPQSWMMV